jgi:uncharacterized protein YjbI with pentapeptide repeats
MVRIAAMLRRKRVALALAVLAIGAVAAILVRSYLSAPQYPPSQAASPTTQSEATQLEDREGRAILEYLQRQYERDNQIRIWTSLLQAVGALVLAGSVYFTWSNLRVAQQVLQTTEKKLDVDRENQITNRFTQAIGQLGAEQKDGKPNLEVRLGGIYALERIAKDSPRDRWTIMEVLTAYVRENAPWPPTLISTEEHKDRSLPHASLDEESPPQQPRADIQAILTVLGRRTRAGEEPEVSRLALSRTDLRGAHLRYASFEAVDLSSAHLEGADLSGANLARANLMGANLQRALLSEALLDEALLSNAHLEGALLSRVRMRRAYLSGAHLEGARLYGADLEEADLSGADLENTVLLEARLVGADLSGAQLTGAELSYARLDGARLSTANLEDARLSEANLEGADLSGARLTGADITEAVGLTLEQVVSTHKKGRGSLLPEAWPEAWRDAVQKATQPKGKDTQSAPEPPPAASAAP